MKGFSSVLEYELSKDAKNKARIAAAIMGIVIILLFLIKFTEVMPIKEIEPIPPHTETIGLFEESDEGGGRRSPVKAPPKQVEPKPKPISKPSKSPATTKNNNPVKASSNPADNIDDFSEFDDVKTTSPSESSQTVSKAILPSIPGGGDGERGASIGGFSGKGGVIDGGRRPKSPCNLTTTSNLSAGYIYVKIQVNKQGNVTTAKALRFAIGKYTPTVNSGEHANLAEKCVKQYQYGKGTEAWGIVKISF